MTESSKEALEIVRKYVGSTIIAAAIASDIDLLREEDKADLFEMSVKLSSANGYLESEREMVGRLCAALENALTIINGWPSLTRETVDSAAAYCKQELGSGRELKAEREKARTNIVERLRITNIASVREFDRTAPSNRSIIVERIIQDMVSRIVDHPDLKRFEMQSKIVFRLSVSEMKSEGDGI